MIAMLGIEDKWVSMAYLLCIASLILCVIYGIFNWNRGNIDTSEEDLRWIQEEKKVEEEL